MNPWNVRLELALTGRRATVPIAQCVHYGAFRYGRDEDHPYETYTRKVVRDGDRAGARKWLVEFLQHYRPRHFGEALGVTLSGRYPLWHYPWVRRVDSDLGWFDDPDGCPDIVTHFSEEGILWFRIEQEFYWLERTIYSIRRHGYRPREGGGITAQKYVRADGAETYLILDGNHRLSALAALGHERVELTYLSMSAVRESDASKWPQVRSGRFLMGDATQVLRAYFDGNHRWRTTDIPAPLLDKP